MGDTGLEIAVIGMSARFPGAKTLDEFWENIKTGRESICFYSDKELQDAGVDPEMLKNPNYVKAGGGILEEVEYFDAAFFDYVPNEALIMNPQMRLFHEYAWAALEHAGYNPHAYQKKIGLYAGASSGSNWETLTALSGKANEVGRFVSTTLTNSSSLATRVSYKLNLKGPAFTIQTACSTSLAAIVLACQGILTGQCNIALAGGVSITTAGKKGYMYKEGMTRSSDGHCRAFDKKAKGMIAGEGIGIVVLKLLEDALADRDTIHAIIKGCAVNNDGNRKVGYTAPSIEGQVEVIRAALLMAEIEAESITYVETHGTGTSLGDPVEIEALKQAFAVKTDRFCAIGSLKTNIGHLDAAAGVAGFIKTVLALTHRLIPPGLHYESPNPKIDFQTGPFYVNCRLKEWKHDRYPLRAGVSSFGIGGTNAHAILEEAPETGLEREYQREYRLILLSARTQSALEKITQNLGEYFQRHPGINLADAAYTLQSGRRAFARRSMLVCSTANQAVEALTAPDPGLLQSFHTNVEDRPVIFMFPGQGAQYVNMGRELYQREPLFREEMDRCFEILKPFIDYDIKEILYPGDLSARFIEVSKTSGEDVNSPFEGSAAPGQGAADINQTEITQPLLFIFEYALAKSLMHWGIKPYAMMGHSIGEYTAACLAGVFSLADALQLVALRGRMIQKMPPGSMLSVSLPESELKPLLDDELSLSAVNSPSHCVVSGPPPAIDHLSEKLVQKKNEYRPLHTSHAFHSKMMVPIVGPFVEAVKPIKLNKPGMPYISDVTGTWITVADAVDPGYWGKHLRKTVQFSRGLTELFKIKDAVFVEIGPGNTLSTFVRQHADKKPGQFALNLVRHIKEKATASDYHYLLNKIGQLWLYGESVDWQQFYSREKRYRIPLPTYPFERQRFWPDESSIAIDAERLTARIPAGGKAAGKQAGEEPLADWFYLPDWKRSVHVKALNPPVHPEAETDKWLVFMDRHGLGTLLVKILQDRGHEAVMITVGPEFARSGEHRYTINPRQPGDYQKLLTHFQKQPGLPAQENTRLHILHLWTLTGAGQGEIKFDEIQALGFYSLLNLAQSQGKMKQITGNLPVQLRLTVISDHWQDVTGEETIEPAKNTMLGPLAVIPQEHPNIRCRAVDIVLPEPGTRAQEILLEQVWTEINSSNETRETTVAFRGCHRLVRYFQSLHLEEVAPRQLPLREKGVYLITGGLGSIGLILAEYLAGEFNARLILTGRSSISPGPGKETKEEQENKAARIRKLEASGAEVMVFKCDAADEPGMKAVISSAEQRWGSIHGIIHSAGLVRGSTFTLIDNLAPELCQQQFQAKVQGTLVLERCFREKSLDFCWLMSSISTVLGGLRFAGYSAANAFMDAFTARLKHSSNRKWICVDWDGMSKKNTIEAFKRILALFHADNSISRLAISSRGNLRARIDQWIRLESLHRETTIKKRKKTLYPRPQLFNPYIPPANTLQEMIAETWITSFGFEQIGIRDDFLELGGDSLKAITLISTLHKQFNVEIPLPVFFENPSIEKLAEYIGNAKEIGSYTSIAPVEAREYYPLSSAQKRLYFLQQLDLNSTSYNMPRVFPLGKHIDKEKLEAALKKLISRHESLRTCFRIIGNEPVQIIRSRVDFAIEYFDSREKEAAAGEISGIIHSFVRPFDLSRPPLIRSGIIKLPDNNYTWLLDLHHIVSDGTSSTILSEDFKVQDNDGALAPLSIQYKDFSQWQNQLFASGRIKEQEDYWLKLYQGNIPRLNLPTDYKRPEVFTFAGDSYVFGLDPGEAGQFKALGTANGGTLYMNILAALDTLFYKYTGQTDIIIGSGIAGRNHVELQRVVGMFINTLAMRNYPRGEKTFREFLQEVIASSIQAFANQDVQFEELVERLDPARDPSRNPLFDISMVVQNFRKPGKQDNLQPGTTPAEILPPTGTGKKLPAHQYKNITAKFDMTFFVREPGDDVHIAIEYYTGIFSRSFIQRLESHLKQIIRTVNKNPDIKLIDMDILSLEEKEQVLYEFNNTTVDYPKTEFVHELIARQMERTPDHVALYGNTDENPDSSVHITYAQLNQKAGQVAGYLYHKKGLKPEEPVGILMCSSLNRSAAILGILKAGGCYVPIDASLPRERIRYIIADAGIGTVISGKKHIEILNRLQWECTHFHSFLCMDSADVHAEPEKDRNELMDRELWHHVGESAIDEITGGGWISSYTGEPLSKAEMDEYGDNIIKKLEPLLHPEMRVLEIGCASGITMFRIAPKVELYYGTDLSQVIIDKNEEKIKQQGQQNIKLEALAAHEIHRLENEEHRFDLIIINSVIQCFHGHNYLREVISQCINLLGEQGYVFIGDIMDQEKKQVLVHDLADFKRKNRGKGYTTKTDFSAELFLSRAFWEDIGIELKTVESVRFSDKIYTIENELTRFRYDVLITVDKRFSPDKTRESGKKQKHQDDLRCLQSLHPDGIPANRSSSNLAYIIYTSGTTGMPRGVGIQHDSLVNLCYWHNRTFHITGTDHATLYAAVGFDASIWELFPYLLKGSVLYLPEESIRLDIDMLLEYFQRHAITISFLPTQLCELFLNMDSHHLSLRVLLTGGDKLHMFTRKTYTLYNNYGPTENTVVTTACPVKEYSDNIPIGKPIDNTSVYIFSKEKMHLQPIGIPGELCIAGAGLSRGYINNPALTLDRFINHKLPHTNYKQCPNQKLLQGVQGDGFLEKSPPGRRRQKIYKTGDLARWLPDGNIEFLGRIDRQVKLRGFRIQLEEIESQLIKIDQIKEAAVITRENETAEKHLCAYIVPAPHQPAETLDTEIIRDHLLNTLPGYMIPLYFIRVEKLPLNSNGKVDRKVLPEPGHRKSGIHAVPQNRVEKKLAEIWAEVLNQDTEINVHDNFFDLGGHSLKATLLTAKIHKEFKIKIPLGEIFKTPTIRGMYMYLNKAKEERYTFIEPVEKKEYYRLSSAQKRMFILKQMDPGNISYNMPQQIYLDEKIDKEKLVSIFNRLTTRHDSLRTSFHMIDDEPVQRIHDRVELIIEKKESGKKVLRDFIRPFDLSQAPLLRVGLQERENQGHLLLIDMHHIISDGFSHGIMKGEFNRLLKGLDLPPHKLCYIDYAQWQSNEEQQLIMEQQKTYWLNQFREELPVLQLPTDYPRPLNRVFTGQCIDFVLESPEMKNLEKLGEKANTSLFMTILSIFNILLAKLSSQEDIIIGTLVAGRRHDDLKQIIGMFVNTLAMRNYPTGEKTFIEFLQEIKTRTLEAFENQEYQFEDLVEKVQVSRDTGRNPIFDVVFNLLDPEFLNFGTDTSKIKQEHLNQHKECTSKFDLTLTVIPLDKKLLCSIEYYWKIFHPQTIDLIIGYTRKILEQVWANPEQKIAEIEIITEPEKQQLLLEFNDTGSAYPMDKMIQQILVQQAARAPDRTIVIGPGHSDEAFHDLIKKGMDGVGTSSCVRLSSRQIHISQRHISYALLNQRADQLAHLLKANGVKPDTVVAIMMNASIEMIMGILGILKAGGAYLPIDPNYPPERRQYMLADSGSRLLVTTSTLAKEKEVEKLRNLEDKKCYETIFIDSIDFSAPSSSHLLNFSTSPSPLAYVLYTSGSTGKPKGVMVEHRSVIRLVINSNFITLKPGDRILQTGAMDFDASTFEIWGSLLNGCTLCLISKEDLISSSRLQEAVKGLNITVMWLTAPLFNRMLQENIHIFNGLATLLVGGDVLSPHHIRQVKEIYPQLRVINGYGPTENTTFSTTHPVELPIIDKIPIGKPISNSTAYILDKYNRPVPRGVPGELWVGGHGLARGYMNNPGLTGEKFKRAIISPSSVLICSREKYNQVPDERLYRTGDLARWLIDGTIEFLGRLDFQVKIRGFRIEPAEIQHQLLKHPQVKEAVVITRHEQCTDPTEKTLCAYIVPGSNREPNPTTLREFLAAQLPPYMVPAHYVLLEEIPLTPNGKIHRNALPEPGFKPGGHYTPPENELEKVLVTIWSDVLAIDGNIDIDDNFFQLGGHSLKATVLANKIHRSLHVRIPVLEIFRIPTIREMAAWIARTQQIEYKDFAAMHNQQLKDPEFKKNAHEFWKNNLNNSFSSPDENHLVLLKDAENSIDHLFFIHDGSGETESYIEFCLALNSHLKCWGIKADTYEHYSPQQIKIQDLARTYINAIKTVQASGPYRIAGWSFGGAAAFEMVRQLEQMNQKIDLLAIIDTPPPDQNIEANTENFTRESELNWIYNFLQNEIYEKIKKVSRVNHIWALIVEILDSPQIRAEALEVIKKILTEYGGQGIVDYQTLDIKQAIKYLNKFRSFHRARLAYVPDGKINAPINYFKATASRINHYENWNRYSLQPIKYHHIAGNHFSIFKSPEVTEFAKTFEQIIKKMK